MSAGSTSPSWQTPSRLSDSLALMLPHLPGPLVGAEAMPWLTSIAELLPPIHRAGFESRLADDQDEVDLQQGIYAADGEPARLARILTDAEQLNDAWRAVQRLAERWSTPGDIVQRGVDEVWLELDAAPATQETPTQVDSSPSVFAVIERARAEALELARQLLALLTPEMDPRRTDHTLTRLALACPGPTRLTHIGVMLGRAVPALRVHVSHMPLPEIAGYLARIGCAWDRNELLDAAAMLLEHGDWLVVCLDVVDDEVRRVGLECFFERKHGVDPRWNSLLESLTVHGLSSQEKADALVKWPGAVTPLQAPWPQDLIVQSLIQPDARLGAFDRRLSHVKLSFAPGARVSAKAYFGYVHVWTHATAAASTGPGLGSDHAPRASK